ncbi:hypothetical protein [Methylobacterium sp. JK268]
MTLADLRRLAAESGAIARLTLVLAVAACAAAAWPIDAAPPPRPPAAPSLDLAGLAAGASGAALARPLFDPGRRDWTALGGREDAFGTARPSASLILRGILLDGPRQRALVDDGAGRPEWRGLGEGPGPWRIAAIAPGRVEVADAVERRYVLTLLGPAVPLPPPPKDPRQWLRPGL